MVQRVVVVGLALFVLLLFGSVLLTASIGQASVMGASGNAAALPTLPTPPQTVPDLPAGPYVTLARAAAVEAGYPPDLFVRQIQVESGFNPRAVSPAGAVGIAQFLPTTAAGLGIDPWNPQDALKGAARLMASYVRQYVGYYAKALAAYNTGTGGVAAAIATCTPQHLPWQQCLPTETQHYLAQILYQTPTGGTG
jgi:soluble lytic murein transglycosylase-like protein